MTITTTAGAAAIDALEARITAKPHEWLKAFSIDDSPLAEIIGTGELFTGEVVAEKMADGSVRSGKLGYDFSDVMPVPLSKTLLRSDRRGWLHWDDNKWARTTNAEARELLRLEMKRIFTLMTVNMRDTADAKRAAQLLSAAKVRHVLEFLEGVLTVPDDLFDSKSWLLTTRNGTVDLRTGEVRSPDPLDYITKQASGAYIPGFEHRDWTKALEAFQDEETAEWMQVRFGQAMTGCMTDDDRIPFLIGGGSNAKTTITQGVSRALGAYAIAVPEQTLTGNASNHPTELMVLKGARFAILEELPEGKHLPSKRLKDLSGTATLRARGMREDFTEWQTTHSLFVNSNYTPVVSDTDEGTWRRLYLVRFPWHYVDPAEPLLTPYDRHGEPGLRERIKDNADNQHDAVLTWLIEGARAWYDMGQNLKAFPVPEKVKAETKTWRESSDLVLAYIAERLVADPGAVVLSKELYTDFTDWLKASGRTSWNDQTFASRFGEHAVVQANGVIKTVTRSFDGLSRPGWTGGLIPTPTKQATVWQGVRFA